MVRVEVAVVLDKTDADDPIAVKTAGSTRLQRQWSTDENEATAGHGRPRQKNMRFLPSIRRVKAMTKLSPPT